MNRSKSLILYHDICICIIDTRLYNVICYIVDDPDTQFCMYVFDSHNGDCYEYHSNDYQELYGKWLELKQEL